MAEGRCLFTTSKGYIGIGLKEILPGDNICVLLGCNTPMILRPYEAGNFIVIGTAYVDGFSEAQALLGPLPSPLSFRYQYNDKTRSFQAAYLERHTGVITLDDPRLEPLPDGWYVKRYPEENAHGVYEGSISKNDNESRPEWMHSRDPRLTPEALRKRGADLKTFRLS